MRTVYWFLVLVVAIAGTAFVIGRRGAWRGGAARDERLLGRHPEGDHRPQVHVRADGEVVDRRVRAGRDDPSPTDHGLDLGHLVREVGARHGLVRRLRGGDRRGERRLPPWRVQPRHPRVGDQRRVVAVERRAAEQGGRSRHLRLVEHVDDIGALSATYDDEICGFASE